MQHVAIDLGGKESQICVRDEHERIIDERRWATKTLAKYLATVPSPSRVILETSSEAFAVADAARAAGHDVRVVPASLAPSLGVGARGIKTDRRDARVLSEVSCRVELRSVHIPSEEARTWRQMCATRDGLVATRTKLVNMVKGFLRTMLVTGLPRVNGRFSALVREKLIASTGAVPAHLERLLAVIDEVGKQVVDATRELGQLAAESEICRRLMTVPGVGPVTAVRFVCAVDEQSRFATAHSVQSYFGLTPGENSSSSRVRRTRLTKAGSASVRWTLVQAAWSAMRWRPNDPMVRWATGVAARRGRWIAVVALARKLAGILFAIWRDGSTYKPQLGAHTE